MGLGIKIKIGRVARDQGKREEASGWGEEEEIRTGCR
jgi:hypothetical protein